MRFKALVIMGLTGIRRTMIGGQALIEGLMMIGPNNAAIAVRKPDGEIIVDIRELPKKTFANKIPIVRGFVGLFRQMILGIKALMYSADFVDIEDENVAPSKIDKFIDKIFGDKFKDAIIYFSVFLSLAFSIGLFILLPNILAGFINFDKATSRGLIFYNLFEGVIRVVLFFSYIVLVSKMKDIKRVWQYHGAEHKTIHCYEHGDELTVENIKKYSTKHPRCGTSFLFTVMIVSIIVFSFVDLFLSSVGLYIVIVKILSRLLIIPIVAGISYEIIKFAGRSEWKIMQIVNAPGLAFQLFTTKEPDDSQIEVAIVAFNNVLVPDKKADEW